MVGEDISLRASFSDQLREALRDMSRQSNAEKVCPPTCISYPKNL